MDTYEATGRNGRVVFDGRALRLIRSRGKGAYLIGEGEKVVPLRSIGGVQLKRASWWQKGYFQVSIVGEVSRSAYGVNYADENSVVLVVKDMSEFEALSAAVNEALASV